MMPHGVLGNHGVRTRIHAGVPVPSETPEPESGDVGIAGVTGAVRMAGMTGAARTADVTAVATTAGVPGVARHNVLTLSFLRTETRMAWLKPGGEPLR